MRVLVMIPTYNEQESIGDVIAQLREHLPQADVLVVDGDSKDKTFERAVATGVHVTRLSSAFGIGGAVEVGFLFAYRAGYDVLARIDGDGQHDIRDLVSIVHMITAEQADMVVGSRYTARQTYHNTLTRTIAIRAFASLASRLTGKQFTDTTSGLMAVNREVIQYVAADGRLDYSEVEAIVILHRAGFNVQEAPATMRQRVKGRSSFTLLRAFYYVFKGLLSMVVEIFRSVPARRRNT